MLNMLEELLEENNLIQENLKEYKEVHRKIVEFDLEKAVQRIEKSKEQPAEKRPSDSSKTTEEMKYAESFIEEYKEFEIPLSKAEVKVKNMEEVLEQYKAELPRLIEENYERFNHYLKKLRKARKNHSDRNALNNTVKGLATRFAVEFKNYFDAGKQYRIDILWRSDAKLKEVNEYLGEVEVEKIKTSQKARNKILKETKEKITSDITIVNKELQEVYSLLKSIKKEGIDDKKGAVRDLILNYDTSVYNQWKDEDFLREDVVSYANVVNKLKKAIIDTKREYVIGYKRLEAQLVG